MATGDEGPPPGVSERMWSIPHSVQAHVPETYPAKAAGPVRRAALRDDDGRLLGYVWTDDREAAGWLHIDDPTPAGVRAGAYVWAVHKRAYGLGQPASSVLDPALYAPMYLLDS